MKRNILLFFIVLFSYCLQTTVFYRINFGGIVPNLLIIVTASYGFMFGKKYGMVVGFICGLLMDIFYGSALGFYALIYLYIGFGNGAFKRIFYQDDLKLPLALITSSDVIYCLVTYILQFLLRGRFDFLFYAKNIILPELIYTILVSIFLYPCILFLNNALEREKKEKRGDHDVA